jgi:hypothetical protein
MRQARAAMIVSGGLLASLALACGSGSKGTGTTSSSSSTSGASSSSTGTSTTSSGAGGSPGSSSSSASSSSTGNGGAAASSSSTGSSSSGATTGACAQVYADCLADPIVTCTAGTSGMCGCSLELQCVEQGESYTACELMYGAGDYLQSLVSCVGFTCQTACPQGFGSLGNGPPFSSCAGAGANNCLVCVCSN